MLFSPGKTAGPTEMLDSIHNYYERLVLEQAQRSDERCRRDHDFLADVACVALNRLPPRYIRHDVDTTFYLSPQELQEIADKVMATVGEAISYVASRDAQNTRG
jgi:hypothetical protein